MSGESKGCGSLGFFSGLGMEYQGDVDQSFCVSNGSLSRDLGDMWRYGCPQKVLIGRATSAFGPKARELNKTMRESATSCHFACSPVLQAFLHEEEMCKVALTCHFSLDVLFLCENFAVALFLLSVRPLL